MRRWGLALLGAAMALTALTAQAQWKWKDSKGQVHLSDLPPPSDVPDKDVLGRPASRVVSPAAPTPAPAPVTTSSAATKPRIDPTLEAKRKQADQEQSGKNDAESQKQAAARADNCQRARGTVATLESGVRIARTNDRGEREILDDKQRGEEMQRAQRVIATDCTP